MGRKNRIIGITRHFECWKVLGYIAGWGIFDNNEEKLKLYLCLAVSFTVFKMSLLKSSAKLYLYFIKKTLFQKISQQRKRKI